MKDLVDEINSCQFVFLQELEDGADNRLVLTIKEAKSTPETEDIVLPGGTIRNVHPIGSDDSSRIFELIFADYIAYSVRNESFTEASDTEHWQGRLFRTYSVSNFLDFVRRSTLPIEHDPGALTHYGIICADHIIDIATRNSPTVIRIHGDVGPA